MYCVALIGLLQVILGFEYVHASSVQIAMSVEQSLKPDFYWVVIADG